MKKIYLLLIILFLIQNIANAQFTRVWEKSDALNNLPSWFSPTGTRERGIAFSRVSGIPKLYVISNLPQPTVIILNALTGDSIGTLNTDGINGGLLLLSDISARPSDFFPITPALYACNLTDSPPFKIYVWESDTSAPQLLIEDYFPTFNIGDHLSLGIDWPDLHFISIASNSNILVDYYSSTGNPPFINRYVLLSDGSTSNNASADYNYVYPFFEGGSYIVNSDGFLPKFYDTLGVFRSVSDSSIISANSNSIKYYANGSLCCDLPLYVSYQYDENNAALVLSAGPPYENFWGETPSLGNNPNPENYGDVEYAWIEWNKLYVFVLSGNNGIGAYYAPGLALPVELSSFTAEKTDDGVLLKWQTATEKNNKGFEILRIIKDEQWDNIGFVPGHGTTAEMQHYSFTDNKVMPGKYQYKLKQIDYNGSFEYSNVIEVEIGSPDEFNLSQNYPNPFNPSTKIKFNIPSVIASGAKQSQNVTLKVYDILGKEITTLVNEELTAGEYEVEFSAKGGSASDGNATNLPSGVYFYQLRVGDPEINSGQGIIQTKKMILLK
jgi:hypothetical protein